MPMRRTTSSTSCAGHDARLRSCRGSSHAAVTEEWLECGRLARVEQRRGKIAGGTLGLIVACALIAGCRSLSGHAPAAPTTAEIRGRFVDSDGRAFAAVPLSLTSRTAAESRA